MMKRIFLGTLLWYTFAAAVTAFGADCTAPIVDNAGVLRGHEAEISQALQGLVSKGADPRVITDESSDTPEQYVRKIQRSCLEWQSSNGGVKNNLIVFLVFPHRYKVGLFLGDEFGHAVNTSEIRSKFMAPAFKDGDFSRGFISGINQTVVQIEAFQSAPLHPAATVINEKPTDLHGFWVFLDWMLVLCVIGGGIFLWIALAQSRRAKKEAQQRAVRARNEAAVRIRDNPDSPDAEDFAQLSNSETWNPDTNGLSVNQYDEIKKRYMQILAPKPAAAPQSATGPQPVSSFRTEHNHHHHSGNRVVNNTTIVNNDPGYIPVPVIVEETPVYHSSHSSDSNDSDSTGFSGGSSSYDSGSSFSDSSSSSDFGSSDSGGGFDGGSSDF